MHIQEVAHWRAGMVTHTFTILFSFMTLKMVYVIILDHSLQMLHSFFMNNLIKRTRTLNSYWIILPIETFVDMCQRSTDWFIYQYIHHIVVVKLMTLMHIILHFFLLLLSLLLSLPTWNVNKWWHYLTFCPFWFLCPFTWMTFSFLFLNWKWF